MLPGIIQQVNLDWSSSVNYYIPTLKRYNNKFWGWLAPSGPQLGGSRTPGAGGSDYYWKCIDEFISPWCKQIELTNWDGATSSGKYIIQSTANVSVNAPMNVTAWWWLEVTTIWGHVLQEARMFSTGTNLAYKLSRQKDSNSGWSAWYYDYAQYSV